jgi:hypothetical protein
MPLARQSESGNAQTEGLRAAETRTKMQPEPPAGPACPAGQKALTVLLGAVGARIILKYQFPPVKAFFFRA